VIDALKTIPKKTEAFGSCIQIQWFCFPIICCLVLLEVICDIVITYIHATALLLPFSKHAVILMQSQWLCSWVNILQGKQSIRHLLKTSYPSSTLYLIQQIWSKALSIPYVFEFFPLIASIFNCRSSCRIKDYYWQNRHCCGKF
jgi:hypothetical protein